MSKSVYIEWRNNGFWVYDVALGVLLKHLIDSATESVKRNPAPWLNQSIERWRVQAVVSDPGMYLDENWSTNQVQHFINLLEDCCESLSSRHAFSADEMQAWDILDGEGIDARGDNEFPTNVVMELGLAIVALLKGALPDPPDRTWWFYGTRTGRTTIEI